MPSRARRRKESARVMARERGVSYPGPMPCSLHAARGTRTEPIQERACVGTVRRGRVHPRRCLGPCLPNALPLPQGRVRTTVDQRPMRKNWRPALRSWGPRLLVGSGCLACTSAAAPRPAELTERTLFANLLDVEVLDAQSDPLKTHRPEIVDCNDIVGWYTEGDGIEVDTGHCN